MCAAAGIGERNRRPMPQKGLATWVFFLAGNLDVSERKIRERKLPCEEQEWEGNRQGPSSSQRNYSQQIAVQDRVGEREAARR